jgi:actin-like ATPase involved in cell morphogenesis
MPINIANDPLFSVVIGSGRALENIEMLGGFQSQSDD